MGVPCFPSYQLASSVPHNMQIFPDLRNIYIPAGPAQVECCENRNLVHAATMGMPREVVRAGYSGR